MNNKARLADGNSLDERVLARLIPVICGGQAKCPPIQAPAPKAVANSLHDRSEA